MAENVMVKAPRRKMILTTRKLNRPKRTSMARKCSIFFFNLEELFSIELFFIILCFCFRSDSITSANKSINLGKAATIHTKVSKNNSLALFPHIQRQLLKLKTNIRYQKPKKKKNEHNFIGYTCPKCIHIHFWNQTEKNKRFNFEKECTQNLIN